jgi:hypothetical protein
MSRNINRYLALAGLTAILAGCGPANVPAPDITGSGTARGKAFKTNPSPAGLPVPPNADATEFSKLVASNAGKFQERKDPFELTGIERAYENEQSADRVFSQNGYSTMVQPEEKIAPPVEMEAQPYRRLSGVVVGDSVLAIIDMGNGGDPVLIHPGDHIDPNWTVVSIDPDKAVLRRSGNVLPTEVVVRLEVAPAGTTPTGGAGFGPGAGGGMPPGAGGFRGGRAGGGLPRPGGGK